MAYFLEQRYHSPLKSWRLLFGLVLIGSTAIVSMPIAKAHHSFAATFQRDARISIEGEVTRVLFKNPHVLLYLDIEQADGTRREWVAEGASAIAFRRGGWPDDAVKPGDYIRIYGDSTHDGSPMVSIESAWRVDPGNGSIIETLKLSEDEGGQNFFSAPVEGQYNEIPLTLADGVTPNFEAIWSYRLPAQTVGARLPAFPFNAAGRARKAAFDVRHDPQVFCDAPGLVRSIAQNPYPLKFTQTDDQIIIDYEEYGGQRNIPITQQRPAMGVKSRLGDSIAFYEGGELIIETYNFLENPATTEGDYISDEAYIVERFSRADDDEFGAIIEIDVTVHDPKYLSEPYTVSRRKSIFRGYQFTPHECEAPLRDRKVVSPYLSLFALHEPAANAANLNAVCESAASAVSQGGKGWQAASRSDVPVGTYYDARGELSSAETIELTQHAEAITDGYVQLLCYATENLIAPVSSQTAPLTDQSLGPNQAGGLENTENKNNNWLYFLGIILLSAFGFLWARRQKT